MSSVNRFTATTTGTPKSRAFSMCFSRFSQPFSRAGRFSCTSSGGSALPGRTVPTPPCIFKARTVATITTQFGFRPLIRHLMLKNFSIPQSAPKPDSVTT